MVEISLGNRVSSVLALCRALESYNVIAARHLAKMDLTMAVFVALDAVVRHGPIAQRDLGSRLSRTSGNVSLIVDELERTGMIVRVRDTIDRRLVFVRPTPKGTRTHAAAVRVLARCIDEVSGSLSADEKLSMLTACHYICEAQVAVCIVREDSTAQQSE